MMKYPIGIQSFEKIIQDGYIYVDKTDLIYRLVKDGTIYFLSRPRRFGKSLLMSTIENYFLGRKELFNGLAIGELEKEWAEYPVFHIDFNASNFTVPGELERKINGYISEWEKIYGGTELDLGIGDRFVRVLKAAHEKTGRRCVVLIDEYDKPLLDVLGTGKDIDETGRDYSLEKRNRGVLKGFYSVFKAADADLQFVLLTGVTKFSQVSIFSGFNQPKDISMDWRYETICGITHKEMKTYFAGPIAEMAKAAGISTDEMIGRLKRKYDGYHFSDGMTDIYNPFSLLNAFDSMRLRNYWFTSGTPEYLVRLLSQSDENIEELLEPDYSTEAFADYKATTEMPLPMIYQSGYLTIKSCNMETGRFRLDFPNEEVRQGFLSFLASGYITKTADRMTGWAGTARKAIESGDMDSLHDQMETLLADIPYNIRRTKNEKTSERDFQYTFYLIFRMMGGWKVYAEKASSHGRADCIVETDKYVCIFEFKLDDTAEDALRQIEEKDYARPYRSDKRKVILVGVSFSSESGNIEDWEVKG